jgi:MFS family permease
VVSCSFLAGIASEFYRPASSALLTDLVPAANRVTAFSAYRMAINAGFAFGPAFAGFLAGKGYQWLFLGDAATSILFGVVAIAALPEGTPSAGPVVGWSEALGVLASDTRLRRILLATLGTGILFTQIGSTFGLNVLSHGLSSTSYGYLLSLNGLIVVVAELPLTTGTRRYRPLRVIALGFAIVGASFGLMSFASTVPMLGVCIAVFTLGEMLAMPVASAYVAGLAPPTMRGRYSGAYGLTWSFAQVFAPALGMRLFELNSNAYFLGCLLLGLLSAGIALGWRLRPRLEPQPSPG